MTRIFKLQPLRYYPIIKNAVTNITQRCFTDKVDTPKPNVTTKQVVVKGSENEERMRVRRARAADVPRVLKFVQEHARATWPGVPPSPASVSHIILCDYVARALSQGHSMLAEQLETKKGWSHIRGVALGASVCSWDATMLEQWSKCVGCPRSQKLMQFTAHCLRAPALHDKYRVHNILQVILIIPSDHPKCAEIALNLMKNSIARGKEIGYPLVRFDVTNAITAKVLEDLQLQKEWELNFDSTSLEFERPSQTADNKDKHDNFIAVYTVLINKVKEST